MTCRKALPANVESVHVNVASIRYPSSVFDFVVCNDCLPHLPDKAGALAEMARVLKPGGKLATCHAGNREQINRLHAEIGDAMAEDRILDSL